MAEALQERSGKPVDLQQPFDVEGKKKDRLDPGDTWSATVANDKTSAGDVRVVINGDERNPEIVPPDGKSAPMLVPKVGNGAELSVQSVTGKRATGDIFGFIMLPE
jgi:hypothetical protein